MPMKFSKSSKVVHQINRHSSIITLLNKNNNPHPPLIFIFTICTYRNKQFNNSYDLLLLLLLLLLIVHIAHMTHKSGDSLHLVNLLMVKGGEYYFNLERNICRGV